MTNAIMGRGVFVELKDPFDQNLVTQYGEKEAILRELRSSGRVAEAITQTSWVINQAGLPDLVLFIYFECRAECYRLEASYEKAIEDAKQMQTLAQLSNSQILLARSALVLSSVYLYSGKPSQCLESANTALAIASQLKNIILIAIAKKLVAAGLVLEMRFLPEAGQLIKESLQIFRRHSLENLQAKAWLTLFMVKTLSADVKGARSCVKKAVLHSRRGGSKELEGIALHLMTFHLADKALRMPLYKESIKCLEFAGAISERYRVIGNMATNYYQLGLYSRSRRYSDEYLNFLRPINNRIAIVGQLLNQVGIAVEIGDYAWANSLVAEYSQIEESRSNKRFMLLSTVVRAELLFAEAKKIEALERVEYVLSNHDGSGQGLFVDTLGLASIIVLELGNTRKALALMERAIEIHKEIGLATTLHHLYPALLWYRYHLVLKANSQLDQSILALNQAYEFIRIELRSLSDEGLRRNYLCKISYIRNIVWARQSYFSERNELTIENFPHLSIKPTGRGPFERLVDIGVRLNQMKTEADLLDYAIDEVVEISGAQRALLVLNIDNINIVARFELPSLDNPEMVWNSVKPKVGSINEAIGSILRHTPANAHKILQKSSIVAPLISNREILGYLYVDIDGIFGRFEESDLQIVTVFASQIAVNLVNVRTSIGLEKLIEAGTAAARNAQLNAEMRAQELSAINDVHNFLASELNKERIVSLVCSKMVDIFDTTNIDIYFHDNQLELLTREFSFAQGKLTKCSGRNNFGRDAVLENNIQYLLQAQIPNALPSIGHFEKTPNALSHDFNDHIYLPIAWGGHLRGAFKVSRGYRRPSAGSTNLGTLGTIASLASIALSKAELFEDNRLRIRSSSVLAEVVRDITSTLDMETAMNRIAAHAMDQLEAQSSAVFVPEIPSAGIFRPLVAIGSYAKELKSLVVYQGKGIIGNIIQSGSAEYVNEASNDSRALTVEGTVHGYGEHMIIAPLNASLTVMGAIAVWRNGGAQFNKADLEFMQGLAMTAVIALQNARMHSDLELSNSELKIVSRHKSDFLANMSHEIRSPMNAVIGMTYLALNTNLSIQQRDYLNKIQQSGHHLLGIINNILDFSKIEAGKLVLQSGPLRITSLIDEVAMLVAESVDAKGLKLIIKIDPDIPFELMGDSLRLRQILINYVSNAIKFTSIGDIHIKTTLSSISNDHAILKFSVCDTGIGIPADKIELLFDSFQQADSSITRKYGGTGLGLIISKQLAAAMEGTVGVNSALGSGSTFWFTAKLEVVELTDKNQSHASEFDGRRTLVVESNAKVGKIIANVLSLVGFNVDVVQSVEAAIAHAEKSDNVYEIILGDFKSLEKLALEISDNTFPALSSRPPRLVLVGSYFDENFSPSIHGLNIAEVIEKPIIRSKLLESMSRLLANESYQDSFSKSPLQLLRTASKFFLGKKVLVVEDNLLNQQIATEFLNEMGIEVSVALNGRIAVEMAFSIHFDAILMDIQMPELDGVQATQMLVHSLNWTKTPIIAMTANVIDSDRQKYISAGMVDLIPKPIEPANLHRTLKKWIAHPVLDADQNLFSSPPSPELDKYLVLSPDKFKHINVSSALTRLLGRQDQYLKILRGFAKSQLNAHAEIKGALEKSKIHDAEILVHTLKGLAATIGAESLSHFAAQLEAAIHDKEALHHLSMVEEELRLVILEINDCLNAVASPNAEASLNVPDVLQSRRDQPEVLGEMLKLLQFDNANSLELFEANQGFFKLVLADNFENFSVAINHLNLSQAFSILRKQL